jgi:hypothetical protein
MTKISWGFLHFGGGLVERIQTQLSMLHRVEVTSHFIEMLDN